MVQAKVTQAQGARNSTGPREGELSLLWFTIYYCMASGILVTFVQLVLYIVGKYRMRTKRLREEWTADDIKLVSKEECCLKQWHDKDGRRQRFPRGDGDSVNYEPPIKKPTFEEPVGMRKRNMFETKET